MTPILALYVSWALTAFWTITAREAGRWCDPLLFGTLHLACGVLALSPWLAQKGRWRRIVGPELRLPFFVLGGLASGLTVAIMQTAVSWTTAANAAIVCQVEVVYSAVISAWMLGERISARQTAASALVLTGTALVLGKDLGTPHWKGDLLILASPWMYQVSHVFSKRLPEDVDAVTITGGRLFYGLVVLGACLAVSAAFKTPYLDPSPRLGLLVLFHGLVLNSTTTVLWYVAIRNLELSKATAVMLSYPALTLVYCWFLGMEPVGLYQVAGLALSMSGALWLTLQMRSRAPDPSGNLSTVPAS
ncbi:MAG: DMT family transporter [Elusimicrobia bacterium]|nr:DMT family transporter [Elusimicrobiota bacterium]